MANGDDPLMVDARIPEQQVIQTQLDSLLRRHGFHQPPIQVQREPNPFNSAFPSELVQCEFADGTELRLFLKYGLENKHIGHGYWGDVGYEARIYGEVLEQLPVSVPRFFGAFRYNKRGQICLVLEYIDQSLRLNKSPSEALLLAANWLGRFHGTTDNWGNWRSLDSLLTVYDTEYYVGWARRTRIYARELHSQYPWLEDLCQRFEELVPVLLNGPATMIHGEFYPANILVADRAVYPVDWQSAAVARGEIDLASLLEGWGRTAIVQECEAIYQQSRWPDGSPGDFREALGVARLYWPLRWLGDDSAWTLSTSRRRYFEQLREEAEHMGLLQLGQAVRQ